MKFVIYQKKQERVEEQEGRDFVPFLLIIWDFKMKLAQNIQSNTPNISQFHINPFNIA